MTDSGELDNTLTFYIVGGYGANAEGGLEDTLSELVSLFGMQLGIESTLRPGRQARHEFWSAVCGPNK